MADLNALRNERKQYINLKNVLLQVCNYLGKSKDSLDLCTNIGSYFNIDGASGDNGIINDSRGTIANDYNLISNQILPEIDVKIRNIGNAISQEEQRLEAERRAQEEAARLAAQQAASNQNSFSSSNTTPSSNSKPSQPSVSKPNVSKPSKPASNNKMKNVSLTK